LADIKISAAVDIATLVGTDMVPVARSASTTAYHATMAEVGAFAATVAPVTSWNTRTGAVTMTLGDVTTALGYTPYNSTNPSGYQTAANVTTALLPYAPLASPTFTGTPTLPTGAVGVTQTKGNNTTALATTAFVLANAGAGGAAVTVSDTPPASPTSGQQWWDSVSGQMFVWYVDANSSQWVAASSQAAGIGDAPNDANTYGRHANGWTQAATPASVTAAVAPALNDVGRNRLHNGGFRINQRTYVSGTALAAAAYAHDRWKAGASGCTYTFTQAFPTTTITITAGTLQQIVETLEVEGGSYMLSWTGSAQGRINAGTYAASPVSVTGLAANTAITVEFNTGTVGQVQLEPGTVATQFERQGMQQDLAKCQRFYQVGNFSGSGNGPLGAWLGWSWLHATQMRASPTLAVNTTTNTNISNAAAAAQGITGVGISGTATAAGNWAWQGAVTASADL
jgi:hypothetical protein